MSQRLIEKYGGLENLCNQTHNELITNRGIGPVKAIKICAIKSISNLITLNRQIKMQITSAKDVYSITKKYANKDQENLLVISLNVQNKVICIDNVYQGTINQIVLHPREILSSGIKNLAARIILVHNHPSGNVIPSLADIETTEKLILAANVIDLEISDHVIISNNGYYSMREHELVDF